MPSNNQLARRVRGLSDSANLDIETWPTFDEGAINGDRRARYLERKIGVKLYLAGESDATIRKSSGLSRAQIYRLITERCLTTHSDGLIYGWRGLVPYQRIKAYARKAAVRVDAFGHGAAGAMNALLDQNPNLRESLEKRILRCPQIDELGAAKRSRQTLWKWFLDELRKLGLEVRKEWPFNTETNGYSTVRRYIDRVLLANPKKAARAIGGPDLEKKLLSGDGIDRPVDAIFQRVEMDAHKLDGRFCVMIPQVTGGYLAKIVPRIWVIVIIEIVSRAVLGYFLSLRREVSSDDVLRAIKRTLTPWHRRQLTFSDVAYMDAAGLPSAISPKYVGVCWNETSVDGALAETCRHVERSLRDVVGSTLISPKSGFSSRRSKDDRPFIESFFRVLASRGFQRMTNTTGGNPKGKQGRDPEEIAITSQFQLEYAEELLDVLIANYNATPHTALGYRTPLKYLEYRSCRPGEQLRYADPESVQSILSYRKKCRVNGGVKEGRKPYVNFAGARYTNEILGQRFDLVGKKIWVVNHLEDDARIAKASTLEGQELGVLRAQAPWHKLPHNVYVRSAINAAARRGLFTLAGGADAVETFLAFCEAQPDGKLPVHAAYLEARRVLVEQADLSIGQSVLAHALEKAGTDDSGASVSVDSEKNNPGASRKERKVEQQSDPLPRRMAASN